MHYEVRDGLAGATVYDMCQDRDGFIWLGTSNGLSRFDGTKFINYTVSSGLPDNDVFKLFVDASNRLWLGTFSKQVSYYANGKVHNIANTPWLAALAISNAPLNYCEDELGNVYVSDLNRVFKIDQQNNVTVITDGPQFKNIPQEKMIATQNFFDGGIYISIGTKLYKYKNEKLADAGQVNNDLDKYFVLKMHRDGSVIEGKTPATKISQTFVKHTSAFVSTIDGAWSVDTVNLELRQHFLPGKKVSKTVEDTEGNLWFSTLGEGIYRLPSFEFKNIQIQVRTDAKEIFSLTGRNDTILCGMSYSQMGLVKKDSVLKIFNYGKLVGNSMNNSSVNKMYAAKLLPDGGVAMAFDAFLLKGFQQSTAVYKLFAVKTIDTIDSKYILVGNFNNAYKVDVNAMKIVDTVFRGRTTKVHYKAPYYYIGSLEGLFQVDEHSLEGRNLSMVHSSLGRRISDITESADGTLWIATNDEGIVGLKNGMVVRTITARDGLSSNICNALFVKENYLFVGTNKGINQIDLSNNSLKVLFYSASDGLPSDQVNAIYVKDSIIYIGTPQGLTYFNEKKVSNSSQCMLKIENVKISGKAYRSSPYYVLPYQDNNIEFNYVAVSFKSGGDITYHYKLEGLDTGWNGTRENILSYPTLPSGDYKLSIYAVNKFGVRSKPYSIAFKIQSPFWQSSTAYVIGVIAIVWVIGLIFNARNKVIQRRLEEKNAFQRKFTLLEQQALQAQMNPHFIFNCLNSIQQYMLTNEREKANQYLTGFASLIRQTLYISSKKSITVTEEVDFLREYLDMEKMRFGDSFSYDILIASEVQADLVEIPALMLQPFVENSLRHGIRYKENGDGYVQISFSALNEQLVCTIKDNGVGRKMASTLKSDQHIEYQSKGMSLTEQRVMLLNQINEGQITIEIVDHYDKKMVGAGTEVIIKIPL